MNDYQILYKWVELRGGEVPKWCECEARRYPSGEVLTSNGPDRLVKTYPPEVEALHMAALTQSQREFWAEN